MLFVGEVKDVVPYINAADLCIFPKALGAASGTTNIKLLEYLACGKAVLTTPLGIEGIEITDKEILIADLEDFPKMIRGEEEKGLRLVKENVKKGTDGSCFFVSARNDFNYFFFKKLFTPLL